MKFITRACLGALMFFLLAGFGFSVLAAAPAVNLSPSSLKFGSQAAGTSSSASTINLSNIGNASLKITSITATGAFTETNNCPATLSIFSRCQIRVTFAPPSAGAFSGSITIVDNANGGSQIDALSGTGTLVLGVSPTSLSFGNQVINTAGAAKAVTLTNSNPIALAITSIVPSGDFSQTNNCGTSLSPHASCSINVTFTPIALGTRSGTLTITDGGTSSPQSVRLSGTGAAASLTSIAVTPQGSSIAPGGTQQFTATGTYNSGPPQNLTNLVTWSSSAATVATISNATGSQGLATAVGAGSTTVRATLNSISGSTSLSVIAPATPALTLVTPNTGRQGQQNESVAITGQYTHFVQGTTTASFGTGITVASLTVNSSTSATAMLNIASTSTLGSGNVTLTTGSEVVTITNGFSVTAFFTVTGSLNTARTYHTATPLNNGKVLIAGGEGPAGILSSVELYDPVAGTFSNVGNMNTARYGHTATLLNNGTVLIAGGYGASGALSNAEIYDPVAGTFTITGSLNHARGLPTATLLNSGMVLLTGGFDTNGVISSAELYNPVAGTFANTGSLNTARYLDTATLLNNGMVLIAGGYGTNNFLNTAELYNPATGLFTYTGNLNTAREYHTATVLSSGLVLLAGGWGSPDALGTAELYDPTAGTFTYTGNLTAVRGLYAASLLNNGMVLLAGGYGSNGVVNSAELYNPVTGTFGPTGSLNTTRYFETATLLSNGRVLIVGGLSSASSSTSYLASAELY